MWRWLLVILACWVVGVPVHAGPDEPAHVVWSAALARGDLSGMTLPADPAYVVFDVPGWAGRPDPACYAFHPEVSASCLLEATDSDESRAQPVRRSEYPVWSGLPSAIGTLGPSAWSRSIGPRLAGGLLAVALVGAALASARRASLASAAGIMVAVTPMVIFSIAVVNPSGTAIAGSIALWTALSVYPRTLQPAGLRWLLVIGYASAVLPRRDGLLWTSLILAIAFVSAYDDLRGLWSALSRAQQAVVILATVLAMGSALTASGSNVGMVAAPMMIPFALLLRRLWCAGRWGKAASAALLGVAVVSALAMASIVRPSGYNSTLLRLIVNATGNNLEEAIGVLGWLDTSMPLLVVWGWCVLVGLLLAGSLASSPGRAIGAATILLASVVVPWIVEMSLEQYRGTYWQGRYTLPLLVGVPIWLASRSDTVVPSALWRAAIGGVALLWNVSFLAALRRWGVGIDGTLLPWRWDTYDAPVSLWVVMLVHLVASVGLVSAVTRDERPPTHSEE